MNSLEYFMAQPGANELVGWAMVFLAFFLGVWTVRALSGGK